MRNKTRILFESYLTQVAQLNGVGDATVKFDVAPSVEQSLEAKIQESSEFLSAINIVPVAAQSGQKVGVGATRPLASRTNTANGNRRKPRSATGTEADKYFCQKTDFDSAIRYTQLDAWSHKAEFQTLVRDAVVKQQGRDRIMIGFNGVEAADETDPVENPLLQDVNVGWLEKVRSRAPARVLSTGELAAAGTKAIYVAADVEVVNADASNKATAKADFNTLDALGLEALELLDPWHRSDTDMVVIVGWRLMKDKYLSMLNAMGVKATEAEAASRILTLPHQIAGKQAIIVPYFPETSLAVTSLDNLSIYVQDETRRRQIKDEPAADQVENYESVNEDYVVEDYGRFALVENIVLGTKPA